VKEREREKEWEVFDLLGIKCFSKKRDIGVRRGVSVEISVLFVSWQRGQKYLEIEREEYYLSEECL